MITKETIQEIANLCGVSFGEGEDEHNQVHIDVDGETNGLITFLTNDDYFDDKSFDTLFAELGKYYPGKVTMFTDWDFVDGVTVRD